MVSGNFASLASSVFQKYLNKYINIVITSTFQLCFEVANIPVMLDFVVQFKIIDDWLTNYDYKLVSDWCYHGLKSDNKF